MFGLLYLPGVGKQKGCLSPAMWCNYNSCIGREKDTHKLKWSKTKMSAKLNYASCMKGDHSKKKRTKNNDYKVSAYYFL